LGLGNPGPKYEATRHNVGWWVVDHLADVWHFDPPKTGLDAKTATGRVGPIQARLVKPQTFMNLSGAALKPYLRQPFWSPKTDLLVIVDDVALPLGTIRLRAGGSAGGHNGLKSVEHALETQDYSRLRIGIAPEGRQQTGEGLADFVLDRFGKQEAMTIRELMPTITSAVETWLREGITPAMNAYNKS
jgi:PTH1 family peptidyl-tRNA hydrolase